MGSLVCRVPVKSFSLIFTDYLVQSVGDTAIKLRGLESLNYWHKVSMAVSEYGQNLKFGFC